MVEYCPECGGMMFPKKFEEVYMLECPGCGFYEMLEENPDFKIKDSGVDEKQKNKEKDSKGKGAVEEGNVFPTYEHKCPKCGHDKAELIDAGVFYSDEDNIYFMRCGKCGFSERIGDMS